MWSFKIGSHNHVLEESISLIKEELGIIWALVTLKTIFTGTGKTVFTIIFYFSSCRIMATWMRAETNE